MTTREPSIDELEGLVEYAEQRVALYKRKLFIGRGEPRRLAELERVLVGARQRLRHAREGAKP